MTIFHLRFFLALCLFAMMLALPVYADSKRAALEINADTFELDSKRNILITSGNVDAVQGDIRLKGPYGLYNQASQRIDFTRGVEVQRGDLRLTADQATADGLAQRIVLKGKVRFFYQDISGQSDNGSYDIAEKTLVFWGDPVVKQGNDQLTGDKILFDSKTGKVTTSGKARILLSVDRFQ
jgi:lipopolysaccharide transport protein LptA